MQFIFKSAFQFFLGGRSFNLDLPSFIIVCSYFWLKKNISTENYADLSNVYKQFYM